MGGGLVLVGNEYPVSLLTEFMFVVRMLKTNLIVSCYAYKQLGVFASEYTFGNHA
ncbi:hypothetical Protein YC6258_02587 [Gynuella sunshinyii YC6258]|uniref:Uncharacterized protein n=1 Tax=Gynuella sunshinyii YC6258 TaxID=1445510 RepID=A0A0C5V592_9GAMM|nr:hypothetical Protein YC6258_02587 [Gynuella sunshinyii YC6258]